MRHADPLGIDILFQMLFSEPSLWLWRVGSKAMVQQSKQTLRNSFLGDGHLHQNGPRH